MRGRLCPGLDCHASPTRRPVGQGLTSSHRPCVMPTGATNALVANWELPLMFSIEKTSFFPPNGEPIIPCLRS
jgi:hypothetical protein